MPLETAVYRLVGWQDDGTADIETYYWPQTTTNAVSTWRTWNTNTTSTTTNAPTTWDNWNVDYRIDATAFGETQRTYLMGTSGPIRIEPGQLYSAPVAVVETPAQVRAREAARRREIRAYEVVRRKREREQAAADRRARRLLVAHLDPDQRDELERLSRFHVIGADGRTYRINRGWTGNVQLIEDSQAGRMIREQYCIHPREAVPVDDNLLAQKLLLESDPATFRRIANITGLHRRDVEVAV